MWSREAISRIFWQIYHQQFLQPWDPTNATNFSFCVLHIKREWGRMYVGTHMQQLSPLPPPTIVSAMQNITSSAAHTHDTAWQTRCTRS
jgi:hypothetical protein